MTQHCTIEELLAVRDGEGAGTALRHVDQCPACRAELDRLHQVAAALRALPVQRPPRDRWPEVRAVAAGARRRRWIATGWMLLAAAAALAVVVGVRGWWPSGGQMAGQRANLDSLVSASQQLEEALRTLDPTSRVLSGRAASTIAELEDGIALVDAQLGEAQRTGASRDDLLRLWQQRVQLMNQLVNVHVTRAAYVGL
jgi:predicted anti-sigma-YlaC factor YlaD